jgi:hypothetical protein
MLLRDHPLMSRHGVPNWPPVWTWVNGPEVERPELLRGEVGILKWIGLSAMQPPDRCYLYIDHEQSSYLGCLLFDGGPCGNPLTHLSAMREPDKIARIFKRAALTVFHPGLRKPGWRHA